MTDAHCHLYDVKFKEDELDGLIKRAYQSGVTTVVCDGAGVKTSLEAINLAKRFAGVYATVGIHPEEAYEIDQMGEEQVKKTLLQLCEEPKVVAIGEAGLDFGEEITAEEIEKQKNLFKINLWLCRQTGLPLVIHNRNASQEIKDLTNSHKTGGQLHCFVQDEAFMQWGLKRGFYISFGGVLTFKSSGYLRTLAGNCQKDKVLLETDAPYLAPEPVRGSRNEPANVKIIAQTLAGIWNLEPDQVDQITNENTRRLFPKIE